MSNTTSESATVLCADADASVEAAPLMLCVDAATDVRCVAVARGAEIVSLVREVAERGQSSVLLAEIDEALRAANVSLREIELYAVTTGPGSFTGLRTGLATIKAFASVYARHVAAVPTLHAVALAAGASEQTLVLMPAGRGEVFAQMLRVDEADRIEELTEAAHESPEIIVRRAARQTGLLKFIGSGARTHKELIRRVAWEEKIRLLDETSLDVGERGQYESSESDVKSGVADNEREWLLCPQPLDYAGQVARLGLIRSRDDDVVRAAELSASYVRPSDAELNERWHR